MHPKQSLCLSLTVLAAISFAAPQICSTPMHPLSNIQCNCLSFSPLFYPTQCSIENSQEIDWNSARTLASKRGMRIQFASESIVAKILAVEEPLPTSVLLRMADGEPVLHGGNSANVIQELIVCGIGSEVKRRFLGMDRGEEVEDRLPLESDVCVGNIIALLLVLILAYAVAESAWNSYNSRTARIRLIGDENVLAAEPETRAPSPVESEKEQAASSRAP